MYSIYAILAVGSGGAVGAVLRYGIGLVVGRMSLANWPFATLSVNVLGSFLMGLFMAWFWKNGDMPEALRLFFAVGIMGALTTFSSFSLDLYTLLHRGEYWEGLLYFTLSFLLSFGGLLLGIIMVRSV